VNLEAGIKLKKAGAQALVAGSFIFGSKSPNQTITELKNL
jgi:pentose-5-phosphate-3-epimerase